MIITKHNKNLLKIVAGGKTIGINPASKNSQDKVVKFGADIAISVLADDDFNGFDQLKFKDKEPFIIKGQGEYEISNIFINGFGVKGKYKGKEKMINSYSLILDGLKSVIFGPIDSIDKLSNEAFEELAKADIYFLPVGGGEFLSAKEAWKMIKQFEPKILIILEQDENSLKEFKDESGIEIEEVDKLNLKSKDLPPEGVLKIYSLKIS